MTLPRLIDAHCHLDFTEFDADREQALHRATQAGITDIIIPGTQAIHWQRIEQLCRIAPQCHACYGLHPYWSEQHSDADLAALDSWIKHHDAVALGECGLDFRNSIAADSQARKQQEFWFEQQLQLAQNHGLPVIIHAVRATQRVIDMLDNFPQSRGMIHSYSGSLEQAEKLAAMGMMISMGTTVTLENAKKQRHVAAHLDLDALLLETDSPDQPGKGHRGERNEPAYIVEALAEIADLRRDSIEHIAQATSDNARELFALPQPATA